MQYNLNTFVIFYTFTGDERETSKNVHFGMQVYPAPQLFSTPTSIVTLKAVKTTKPLVVILVSMWLLLCLTLLACT